MEPINPGDIVFRKTVGFRNNTIVLLEADSSNTFYQQILEILRRHSEESVVVESFFSVVRDGRLDNWNSYKVTFLKTSFWEFWQTSSEKIHEMILFRNV